MSKAEAAYLDNVSRYSEGSKRSAEIILRIVCDLIRPSSVIDVGCSIGTWLSVCNAAGTQDFLGIDGDYVDRDSLMIPRDSFQAFDLTKSFLIGRRFDLVMTLEVAEHLPKEAASSFVHSLTELGPVVLFSAAIPFQGGTGHINEQWPEYWATLFGERGYVAVDCIRHKVWNDPNIQVWYAQNCLLFVEESILRSNAALLREHELSNGNPLNIVHPRSYLGAADPKNTDPRTLSFDQCLSGLIFHIKRKVRSHLHWRLRRLLFKQ
jgi:hypothetical protein